MACRLQPGPGSERLLGRAAALPPRPPNRVSEVFRSWPLVIWPGRRALSGALHARRLISQHRATDFCRTRSAEPNRTKSKARIAEDAFNCSVASPA
eukprot:8903879-Alexandrium_andersonii.AAC.1